MLAVVYSYSDVSEKWTNIKFISEKEKKEMQNKLKQSMTIVKQRKKENKRRVKEKMNILTKLNSMIDRFDENLKKSHIVKLEDEGKLKKMQEKAVKMEEDLKAEHKFLGMQKQTLEKLEKQYDNLCTQFKVEDLNEFSKTAENVLGPKMD